MERFFFVCLKKCKKKTFFVFYSKKKLYLPCQKVLLMLSSSKNLFINMAVSELTALGSLLFGNTTLTAPPPLNFLLCQKVLLNQKP